LSPAHQGQGGGGQGGGRGAGGMNQPQLLQQVLGQLDLTADQKTKIDGVLKQAQQDMADARQSMQDATPQERMQKMQEMQKDVRSKVEAELTPDQKSKFYPLVASTGLKFFTEMVTAMKATGAKMDLGDDKQKQLNQIFDGTDKSLDGMKTDAGAVKDEEGAAAFQQKMTKLQMQTRKQLVEALGQDDARELMQGAMRSMAPTGGRTGTGAEVPTTQPATK
jgi:hypothetical protein